MAINSIITKPRIRHAIFIAAILQVITSNAFSQMESGTLDSVLMNPNLRFGILPNGFSYYLLKNDNPKDAVEISFIEKAGYYTERESEVGVAHLIEHLAFRSTKSFPDGLKNALEKLGLKNGANFFGSTSDVTSYGIQLPYLNDTLQQVILPTLLDWANGLQIVREEFEQERAIVLNELERSETPSMWALADAKYFLLDKSPLYIPLGKKERSNIRNVSLDEVIDFYTRWYQPKQQAVIIVGDFDMDKIEFVIKRTFSNLASISASPIAREHVQDYNVPLSGNDKVVFVNHGNEDATFYLQWLKKRKVDSDSAHGSKLYQIKRNLIDGLFEKMIRMRLDETVSPGDALQRSVRAINIKRQAIDERAGIDAIYGHISARSINEAMTALQFVVRQMDRVERWGFSQVEIDEARKLLIYEIHQEFDHPSTSKYRFQLIRQFLGRGIVVGNEADTRINILNTVSLEDVNQMIKNWLATKGNTDILVSHPDTQPNDLPSENQILSWMTTAKSTPLQRHHYVGVKDFSEFKKTSNLDYKVRSIQQNLDAVELLLTNGIKVVIKRLGGVAEGRQLTNQVSIRALSLRGIGEEKYGDTLAIAIETIVSSGGLGNLNELEYQKWLAQKNKTGYLIVSPYIKANESGITGECSISNLQNALHLVYLYLTELRVNKNVINSYIESQAKDKMPRGNKLEDSVFTYTRGRRQISGQLDFVNNLNPKQVLSIYHKYFSNPGNFQFIITGYFEMDHLIPDVVKYLGALPIKSNEKLMNPIQTTTEPIGIYGCPKTYDLKPVLLVGDSIGNVKVRLLFVGAREISDQDKLKLEAINEAIRIQLFRRLREKEKGVYSVWSFLSEANLAGRYFIDIGFEAAPSDVDRLIDATRDELNRIRIEGIPGEVFNSSILAIKSNYASRLKYPQYWADFLSGQILLGRNLHQISTSLQQETDITLSDVNRIAKEFIDVSNYKLFKLL